jgi:hypothetical protein
MGAMPLLFFIPLASGWVSLVYFFAAPKSAPVKEVVLGSLHGVLLAGLTVFGFLSISRPPLSPVTGVLLSAISLLGPPLLIALAMRVYRGPRWVHRLQLINLLCYLQLLWFTLFLFLGILRH